YAVLPFQTYAIVPVCSVERAFIIFLLNFSYALFTVMHTPELIVCPLSPLSSLIGPTDVLTTTMRGISNEGS
ncbi:hypothetical protein RAF77_28005, partial [Klebsiella pneumoniae]